MKSQRSYTEASRLKVLRFGQSTKNGFCGTLDGYIKGRGQMNINPGWEKDFIKQW